MKREKALVEERRRRIVEALVQNPKLRVDELSERFAVSVVTMRRDLQALEDERVLVRFHGGARVNTEVAHSVATAFAPDYRDAIARYAATLAKEEDTLFINTSSNALGMIRYMSCENVTVITNNGRAIAMDRPAGVNVILTGGEMRHPKEAMVGDFALRNLATIFAKKAFIGCSGVSAKAGMTTEIANEVRVNQMMIDHAKEVYLLADHTKLGHASSFISCTIDKIQHLITDELAPADEVEAIKACGVQVYQVDGLGNLML